MPRVNLRATVALTITANPDGTVCFEWDRAGLRKFSDENEGNYSAVKFVVWFAEVIEQFRLYQHDASHKAIDAVQGKLADIKKFPDLDALAKIMEKASGGDFSKMAEMLRKSLDRPNQKPEHN